ncbi:MAG: TSUP family transporter [Acidimicrobiales bacterium]
MEGELLGLAPAAWAVTVGVVLLGALLQGSLGFGMGLLAAPIVVLIDPTLVPVTLIGLAIPVAALVVWRERTDIDFSEVQWAIVGRFPGAIVGAMAVAALGTRSLSIVFAVSILAAVATSVAGLAVPQTTRNLAIAGFVSGVTGTATSIGGPPMAIVLQRSSGSRLRMAMSMFNGVGAAISLVFLLAVGEVDGRDLGIIAVLAPAAFIGFAISGRTNRFLDGGHTRQAVLLVAAASAIVILIRSW